MSVRRLPIACPADLEASPIRDLPDAHGLAGADGLPPLVVLVDADSTIPNLALMRLSTYLKAKGYRVVLVGPGGRTLWTGKPVAVYASSVFRFSEEARAAVRRQWGDGVMWGGTGVRLDSSLADVNDTVTWDAIAPDYSLYPAFKPSLGFTQRGCRLTCDFCVVPQKEGRPQSVGTLASIWRGAGHPRKILLLDNDFFGHPEKGWRPILDEARAGKFKLCFSQGINLRLVTDEAAAALKSIEYRDNEFKERRLYTAWDSLDDGRVFKRGLARLGAAGIPPEHLMVYMLIGHADGETWDDIFLRFTELVSLGCLPYPMPYDRASRPDLCAFERWVKRGLYRAVAWPDYATDGREDARLHGTPARVESDAAWRRVVGNRKLIAQRGEPASTKPGSKNR